jgi:hypothetical protein
LIICTLVALASCENALGPQLDSSQTIKTETKWSVSPINKAKQYIVEEVKYNNQGRVINRVSYNEFGKLKSSSSYTYEKNKEIEIISEYIGDKVIKELTVTSIIENGLVVSEEITNTNGAVVDSKQYSYDNNGNIISIKNCINDSGCDNTVLYDNKYDGGNLRVTYTINNNGDIAQKDSLVYRLDENYFERITTDNNGNIYYTTGYKIDKNGRIVEEFIKNPNGLISKYYIYEFTYFE